jgi:peroxidase
MASASCISLVLLVALAATAASAQLSSTFYDTSCPRALATIKSGVAAAVSSNPRMGASLLRLHFHDCFVNVSKLQCFTITGTLVLLINLRSNLLQ